MAMPPKFNDGLDTAWIFFWILYVTLDTPTVNSSCAASSDPSAFICIWRKNGRLHFIWYATCDGIRIAVRQFRKKRQL